MKKPFLLLSLFAAAVCTAVLNSCSSDEPEAPSGGGGGGETTAEAVDLGLSVRWANCNVGANAPYEAGGLYGWADPEGTATTMQVHDSTGNWTSTLYGGTDPLPDICRTSYDLPHMKMGGYWRLPTEAEAKELLERCAWRKETVQGTTGYRVTGPNGNSIFLPMAGMRQGNERFMQGQRGYYWTGTREPGATGAVSLWVGTAGKGEISSDYRYQGCSIRPVFGSDSTTVRYDSPLDTVDRRVDMGILSDSGKPLYWASGNLIVRRYARSYIAHEPTFVPDERLFSESALEWDLFAWGDPTGRVQYYSPEWEAMDVQNMPENISGDVRYDIARAQLGGNWRLPTANEWRRLLDNCEQTHDTLLRHFRIWLTSKINGNVLCLDDVRVLIYLSDGVLGISRGNLEYLTGNKWQTIKLSLFMSPGASGYYLDLKPIVAWAIQDYHNMLLVRPVTE
ncbi:MAG: hypothetical protein ACOYJE_05345 [Bacteroidaceae bacterium]|jgi:hypothetical protein